MVIKILIDFNNILQKSTLKNVFLYVIIIHLKITIVKHFRHLLNILNLL